MKEELSRSETGVETVSHEPLSIRNHAVSREVGQGPSFKPVRGPFTVYSLLTNTCYHLVEWRLGLNMFYYVVFFLQ